MIKIPAVTRCPLLRATPSDHQRTPVTHPSTAHESKGPTCAASCAARDAASGVSPCRHTLYASSPGLREVSAPEPLYAEPNMISRQASRHGPPNGAEAGTLERSIANDLHLDNISAFLWTTRV